MRLQFSLLFFIIFLVPQALPQTPPLSIPEKPFSYRPYRDFEPCYDTLKFLGYKRVIEVSLGLPSWKPVTGHEDVAIFEGTVIKTPNTSHINTKVSQEDMPLYHYTHDFTFNAIPDEYPDNRCSNLLCAQVIEKNQDGVISPDTLYQRFLHLEWETGLGMANKKNPCRELNLDGKSCGFFSVGHERGDTIWNWPTIGDWVHVEGLWVFDRGHPPAYTEIHPMRFIGIRRSLPEKINHPNKPGEKIWATRVDVYANGDGGALYNNTYRTEENKFVHPVKMGAKDYTFSVKPLIPQPTTDAHLRFVEVTQKGNTFSSDTKLLSEKNGEGAPSLNVTIPWKGQPDSLVLAKTIYLYWDAGNGKPEGYSVTTYKVTLLEIRFRNRKEFFTPHEMRAFANVGDKWFFLNELFGKDFLRNGMGSSYKKRWKLNLIFYVDVPYNGEFRVHAGSWEDDGIEKRMGWLFDPFSPCTKETKKNFKKQLMIVSPLRFRGCLNDLMGEVHDFYTPQLIGKSFETESLSKGEPFEDLCICNKDLQNDMFSLKYKIEKVRVE